MCKQKIKFQTWSYFLIYLIVFICHLFLCSISTVDEFFRYRVISGMIDGSELYKDINIITTPLIYYVGYIFLLINNSVLMMRIINILIWMITLFFIHKIAKKFNFDENIVFLFNFILITLLMISKTFYYDYNHYCLMFSIILIYILLFKKYSYKNSIIIGLICSLLILTKQTTGCFITLSTAISILYLNKNKDNNFYKKIFLTILTGFIVLSIFALKLILNNNFYYFCDLCILGIGQFAQNLLVFKRDIIIFFILIFFVIFSYKNNMKKLINKNNVVIFVFIITTLINSYPILDIFHLCIPFVLIFMLAFNLKIFINKNMLFVFSICCSMILFTFFNKNFFDNQKSYCEYKGYEKIKVYNIFKNDCEELIDILEEYENKEIYIIDIGASAYNHVLDISNSYYDLLFTGHTGTTTSLEHIINLKNKDCLVIINKIFKNHYQLNSQICEYIVENYEKINETKSFYVYKP